MTPVADLEAQLEELRGALSTLQAAITSRPRLQLTAFGQAPYLGQSVALTAAVARADGSPLSGLPVTLVTSWGDLRGEDDRIEGGSISTLTGADGTIRATLRPNASIDDSEEQDALEGVLAQFDPAADNPSRVVANLQSMAAQYRWEANLPYRNAVDAYFRAFGQKLLHSSTPRDYMVSWPRIPATVIAFLGGPDQAVAATITVRFRDWLGAWLQVYRQLTASQNSLDPDFQSIKKQALGPSGLIAGIFDRAGIYVDNELGAIGRRVAQETAQNAIGRFLDAGVSDLPTGTRASVGSVLATGSKALATSGPGVLAVLGQTHVATETAAGAIANKVDKAEFSAGLAGKANSSDLLAVQTAVGGKADLTALDAVKAQTTAALAGKADLTAFQKLQSDTGAMLTTKANVGDLQALQTAIGSKVDKSVLDAFQAQISSAIASKANMSDLQAVQTAIASKANVSDLQAVQTAVTAKANKAAFDAFQTQVNTALGRKADLSALQALQTATNTALASKVDNTTFDGFRRQVNDRLPLTVTRSDLDNVRLGLEASINAKADTNALTALETRTTRALAAKADSSAVSTIQNRMRNIETRIR